MGKKITDYGDKLIARGYHEYLPSPLDHQGIQRCFQKRFDDEIGKKYFINVHEWESIRHPHTGEITGPSYEYEVYLETEEEHDPVRILFYSSWNIEKVEKYLDHLFSTGGYAYYEKWEDV